MYGIMESFIDRCGRSSSSCLTRIFVSSLSVVDSQSLPVCWEDGADRSGEECSQPAVTEVLGHPHVALLAPAPPPAVLQPPEPAQLVLNTAKLCHIKY